jgi:hypothetical protein
MKVEVVGVASIFFDILKAASCLLLVLGGEAAEPSCDGRIVEPAKEIADLAQAYPALLPHQHIATLRAANP